MIDTAPFPSESHAVKCELAAEILRSTGKLRLQVTGWSMLPSIFPGDTLLVERATGDEVRQGDIVLCIRDRRFFAHRVLGRTGDSGIQTRGDAMATPDSLVQEKEMIGKVALILRNGKRLRPRQKMRASARIVAALAQRSTLAARIVVGVHSLRPPTTA
jgi:signal peptidase I